MNRKIRFLAIAAAALAAQAFAESPTVLTDDFVSTASREAVQAELAAFKTAGVNPWSSAYDPLQNFASTRSRASVTADYIAARAEVAATMGEDSGSARRPIAVRVLVSDTLALK
jgi:hypothetical protein